MNTKSIREARYPCPVQQASNDPFRIQRLAVCVK